MCTRLTKKLAQLTAENEYPLGSDMSGDLNIMVSQTGTLTDHFSTYSGIKRKQQ